MMIVSRQIRCQLVAAALNDSVLKIGRFGLRLKFRSPDVMEFKTSPSVGAGIGAVKKINETRLRIEN